MYLKVALDGTDVTNMIDTAPINDMLYEHFTNKAARLQEELDNL
jgi:hypothetical protein